MERKQSELMDFIVYLKDRKKDLKKNMREQLKRISDCFSEVRKCLIFYEQQAVKVVEEQFKKFVDEMEVMGSDSREKAAFLEEQGLNLHNRLKSMSKLRCSDAIEGWVYDRYLIEA